MWEALEQVGWIKTMGSTGWMYAGISVAHYLGIFWFVGSMAIVDLRVMGIGMRSRNVGELAKQLFPWAWIGFALAMIAGFLMFATDAGDWAPSRGFHIKLAMIAVSVVFAIIIQIGAPKWAEKPEIPKIAKIVALVALLLWVATILSASEIPALEGLG